MNKKVKSEFTDGVWFGEGGESDLNELLEDIAIEVGEEFGEDFFIDIVVTDITNNLTKAGSITTNYNCHSLPPEVKELIENQETEVGKKVMLDLAKYFKDPDDPKNERLSYKLKESLENAKDLVDIKRLDEDSFEIIANGEGEACFNAMAMDECKLKSYQDFCLDITEGVGSNNVKNGSGNELPGNNTNNNNVALGFYIGGGIVLSIFTGIVIYKICTSEQVKNCCKKLKEKIYGNNNQLAQEQDNNDQIQQHNQPIEIEMVELENRKYNFNKIQDDYKLTKPTSWKDKEFLRQQNNNVSRDDVLISYV